MSIISLSSSRKVQNIHHVVITIRTVLVMLTGVFVGKEQYLNASILFILLIIFSCLNAEIFYKLICKVQSEKNCKQTKLEEE